MKGCVVLTYEEVCEKFNEIMSFLEKDNYQNVFDQIDKTVVRREQSSGGECMHRGYYCPSIIEDIVIGNIKRGRLIKKLSKRKILGIVFILAGLLPSRRFLMSTRG